MKNTIGIDTYEFIISQGPVYLRKFVLDGPIKMPGNLGGEWKVEMKFYAEGFEDITFDMDVYIRLEPMGLF